MKLAIKKFIYLINDITNLLLSKDKRTNQEKNRRLLIALIIVSIILVISLITNIYLLFIFYLYV
ncbi:hypothetical protein CO116_01130 [Candidatus Falkowbacteria bacterium CG_4_9_14_3_um_filter_38_19]|uniref:Uncharacterized protein n=1 Tax=Candidatus Falkowbacteria bacterium CG_4_9_14_3_um_filter_38_19 TaxID=1974559 RepID=A0A2M8AIG0_9BACT|nr:hypothetical protein [Candidatus Falkowbacteria bacterium]PJB17245.1 MAG: hypothetical protein CO116_01130 [Candidatus Falkowbacteria bacterium CG_4_9_14_3_um_filter_38_19]